MKIIKRASLIFFALLILCASMPVSAFATGEVVQFTETAKLGASIVDLYGMANNTNLAYDIASSGSALTVIENLYTEYSTSAGDPYTLAAIGAAAAAAGTVAVIYDAVTGQGYIQLYQEQYVSSLDGYWDYQLTDAGLVRDQLTDLFSWTLNQNDTVTPISVYSFDASLLGGITLTQIQTGMTLPTNQSGGRAVVTSISGAFPVYYYVYENTSNKNYYQIICYDNTQTINIRFPDGYFPNKDYTLSFSNQLIWKDSNNTAHHFNPTLYCGYSSTFGSQLAATDNQTPEYTNGGTYSIPSGVIDSNTSIDSVDDNVDIGPVINEGTFSLEIPINNPTSPEYHPEPKRITTTMPIPDGLEIPLPEGVETPEYGVPYPVTDPATLNAIVPELWDGLVANDVSIQDTPQPEPGPDPAPNPSEVFVPLLPVTIPSFNFNLAGIWHYVREWVASLGAWFSMVFTIWSHLPYAIVVPVYATAVIVIVLGVYKRFFM